MRAAKEQEQLLELQRALENREVSIQEHQKVVKARADWEVEAGRALSNLREDLRIAGQAVEDAKQDLKTKTAHYEIEERQWRGGSAYQRV